MRYLTIPRRVLDVVIKHAESAVPLEAVGLLGGNPEGKVALAVPMVNLANAGWFFADPYSQYRAQQTIRNHSFTPLAVYHSHPGGGSYPSLADLTYAAPLNLDQVIIALARDHRSDVEIRGYRVTAAGIAEIHLKIEEAAAI